mmetsp:Transcript_26325/g.75553  ORF Transcript_26325/g.75553 Transcript_26325/m.75553 type:complete len:223 (+) Transcript_26325:223-891(+)
MVRACLTAAHMSAGQKEDLPWRLHADAAGALISHSPHGLQLRGQQLARFQLPLQPAGVLLPHALRGLELPGEPRELLLSRRFGAPHLPPQPVALYFPRLLGELQLAHEPGAVLLLSTPCALQLQLKLRDLFCRGPFGVLELRCEALLGLLGRPLRGLQVVGKLPSLLEAGPLYHLQFLRQSGNGPLPLGQGAARQTVADREETAAEHFCSTRGLTDGPTRSC